jgi:hypothetical protein
LPNDRIWCIHRLAVYRRPEDIYRQLGCVAYLHVLRTDDPFVVKYLGVTTINARPRYFSIGIAADTEIGTITAVRFI